MRFRREYALRQMGHFASAAGRNSDGVLGSQGEAVASGGTIPYFRSRKLRNRCGKTWASSCQLRILHLLLSSELLMQRRTAYHSSIRSGRRASTSTQKER